MNEEIEKGSFRMSKHGNIEFNVGWCALEEQDMEDLKYILAKRELNRLKQNKNTPRDKNENKQ